MIKSLYTLSPVIKDLAPEYFTPWANPFPKVEEGKAKVLLAIVEDGEFLEMREVPFSAGLVDKYLYRKPPGANGTNLVPTLIFTPAKNTEKDATKYPKSVEKLVKKVEKSLSNYNHDFLGEGEVDKIANALLDYEGSIDFSNRYLFTMQVSGQWFGEVEAYRQLFEGDAYNKYHEKSSAKNKVCAVTYEEVEEVWGRVDTLGFTINDIAFSRNGFQNRDSYKMFPVSPPVVKALEGTKRFVLDRLAHNFYSLKYFILPHFIQEDAKASKKIIKDFLNRAENINKKATTETIGNGVISNEKYVKNVIDKYQLNDLDIYFDLFFYQQQQAQFLIKLHIQDVLPSRLKKAFETKQLIERKYQQINRQYIKKEDRHIEFKLNFRTIAPFFSYKVKTDTVFTPFFFRLLEAVFYGRPVEEQLLLKGFLEQLRKAFKDPEKRGLEFPKLVRHSLAIHQFYHILQLLKNGYPMESTTVEANPTSLTLESFIEEHEDSFFYRDEYKKGVFMLGCLTQVLLSRQYKRLKSQPFFNKLNNLVIGEKEVQELFPKVINKLNEYDYRIPEMEGKIGLALVKPSDLTKTEISYAFTLGMVMQREFSKAFGKSLQDDEGENPEKTE